MRLDSNEKIVPYLTKAERIAELEAALQLIEHAKTLQEAQDIAVSFRRVGKRWAKTSPLSFHELRKIEVSED